MRISYRLATYGFFTLYLIPVMALGFLVRSRIEERQLTLQRFLQNQVDVDRRIITERGRLRSIHVALRSSLIGERRSIVPPLTLARDEMEKFDTFWKRYEANYAATNRPFLRQILAESQELNLVEEEEEALRERRVAANLYLASVAAYPPLASGGGSIAEHGLFLDSVDEKRQAIYSALDHLADLRYIFGQRVVFSVSGENDRQEGFFTAVFIALFSAILLFAVLEYFFIHKPFKDIMLFLADIGQGKRGERLYFSTPISEIKKSEEIINSFVKRAERHDEKR